MMLRLLETDDCETAAGRPGRAVIILLILAALIVIATSVVIAVRGQDGADASAPGAAVVQTVAGWEAPALGPISRMWPAETGFTGDLRD